MMCPVCRCAGNVGVHPRFWTCPACGGAGVLFLHGPPTISIHAPRFDFWRKQAAKAARKAANTLTPEKTDD